MVKPSAADHFSPKGVFRVQHKFSKKLSDVKKPAPAKVLDSEGPPSHRPS